MNKDELKNGLILGSGALIALLVIVFVFLLTKPQIDKTNQQQLAEHIAALLPPGSYNNNPANDRVMLSNPALGVDRALPVYRAMLNDKPVAAVITAIAPDGYNGNINLLISISVEGEVLAVRVTDHRETPGLGDDIDERKSNWIHSFNGVSVQLMPAHDWQAKKDGGQFDQFTGATITPRAVIQSVYKVAQWYLDNQHTVHRQSGDTAE